MLKHEKQKGTPIEKGATELTVNSPHKCKRPIHRGKGDDFSWVIRHAN